MLFQSFFLVPGTGATVTLPHMPTDMYSNSLFPGHVMKILVIIGIHVSYE